MLRRRIGTMRAVLSGIAAAGLSAALSCCGPPTEPRANHVVLELRTLGRSYLQGRDTVAASQTYTPPDAGELGVALGALPMAAFDAEELAHGLILALGELAKRAAVPESGLAALAWLCGDPRPSVYMHVGQMLKAVKSLRPDVLRTALAARERDRRLVALWVARDLGPDAIDAVGPLLSLLDTDLEEAHRNTIFGVVRSLVALPGLVDVLCDDLGTLGLLALPEAVHLLELAHERYSATGVIPCLRRTLRGGSASLQLRVLRAIGNAEPWEGEWLGLAMEMVGAGADVGVREYAESIVDQAAGVR